MKEDKTIEARAKEYLKTYGMEDDVIKELTWADDLTMTKLMADFHKQELSNALPSDQKIDNHYPSSVSGGEWLKNIGARIGAKWVKRKLLNNIK